MNRPYALGALFCLLLVVGCGPTGDAEPEAPAEPAAPDTVGSAPHAEATLAAKSGSGTSGTAAFSVENGQVVMRINIVGATPGEHAFHVHEVGDCSSDDGKSAGGHWNPTAQDHGKLGESVQFHYGDTGNVTIAEDGTGSAEISGSVWTLGDGGQGDVVGRAVVVHAGADDFVTQPTGAAGGRVACGVIEMHEP